MNKIYIILAILFLNGCQFKSKQDFLIGKWQYQSVIINDNNIEIDSQDALTIESDGTFRYQIQSMQLSKNGKWHLENNFLLLDYESPDTIRTFEIKILSKFNLKLIEGNNTFILEK
jgi:hypothetical protein